MKEILALRGINWSAEIKGCEVAQNTCNFLLEKTKQREWGE